MNTSRACSIAGAFVICIAHANAQTPIRVFCAAATRYFINPPSEFLAERTNQTGSGTWNSNQSSSNSRCEILVDRSNQYRSRCFYNERGSSSDVAVAWYKEMETNMDQCISMLPEPQRSKYKKSTDSDTQDDGTKVVSTTWENDDESDADYTIEIDGWVDPSGRVYNEMEVSYKKY